MPPKPPFIMHVGAGPIEPFVPPNNGLNCAFTSNYVYNETLFEVLVTDDPPPDCDRDGDTTVEIAWARKAAQVIREQKNNGFTNEMENDRFWREMESKIKELARPMILELAPAVPAPRPPGFVAYAERTVKEALFPEKVKLQLVTRGGKLEVIPGHFRWGPEEARPVGWDEVRGVGFDDVDVDVIPRFAAGDVVMMDSAGAVAWNMRVPGFEDGKLVGHIMESWQREEMLRELGIYSKLRKVKLDSEVRIQELRGFITHDDGIVGILLDKIPSRHPKGIPDEALGKVPPRRRTTSLEVRRKWAAQIEHTVTELHKVDIIWGDAAPQNVIVDKDDNAWITNFRGGRTRPWIKKALQETVEGDLGAVEKMKIALVGTIE